MRRLPTIRWHALFLLAILISGCINIERSYPDKRYFVLDIRPHGNPSHEPVKGILEVSDLRISPRYQGQSFVYRISDTGFEADFYNQFLIAPASLITEEVRDGLAQSRIFNTVVNASSQLQPTHRLEGTVHGLYGDFRAAGAGMAVVDIQFLLTKAMPAGVEILMDKRYSKSVPLSRRSAEALVKGWDEALEGIANALIADLMTANLQKETRSVILPGIPGKDKNDAAESR